MEPWQHNVVVMHFYNSADLFVLQTFWASNSETVHTFFVGCR